MIRSRQAGMVSILVTMIMMIVISLIVLGFAQVSRREQRQALDRQLSTQAYYAAESAINDVRAKLQSGVLAADYEKDTCGSDGTYTLPTLDAAGVAVTCLLVSTKVTDVTRDVDVGSKSVIANLEPESPMRQLKITWTSGSGSNDLTNCATGNPSATAFPSQPSWRCPYGVLRLDLVPTDQLNRSALTAQQVSAFLYPLRAGGPSTHDIGHNFNGSVSGMRCSAASCVTTLTGLDRSKYAVRLTALYAKGTTQLQAQADDGTPLILKNGQTLVDATGKAQDVLRRVQVRLSAQGAPVPADALDSGSSVCKRFEIDASGFAIYGTGNQDQHNPLCIATGL